MEKNRYLFVGGCARSGTSALTNLLSTHNDIILGMERYNKLCVSHKFSLNKEHFTKKRFFKVKEGDTFYNDFLYFKMHENIADKWDNAKYIGIKYTQVDKVLNIINDVFGDVKFIYIYRNIFDVAESWNRRAIEAENNWTPDNNYKKAVIRWNESLSLVNEYIENGYRKNIICLNFYDLFYTDKSIKNIFHFLNLKINQKVIDQIKYLRSVSNYKKSKKGKLTQLEIEYIKNNANIDLFEHFNKKHNILSLLGKKQYYKYFLLSKFNDILCTFSLRKQM